MQKVNVVINSVSATDVCSDPLTREEHYSSPSNEDSFLITVFKVAITVSGHGCSRGVGVSGSTLISLRIVLMADPIRRFSPFSVPDFSSTEGV